MEISSSPHRMTRADKKGAFVCLKLTTLPVQIATTLAILKLQSSIFPFEDIYKNQKSKF